MINLQDIAGYVPFLALVNRPAPPGRPMMTRLMEQAIVGLIAALATTLANDYRQDEMIKIRGDQIEALAREVRDASIRLDQRLDRINSRIEKLDLQNHGK